MQSWWIAVFALIAILFPGTLAAMESGSGDTPNVTLVLRAEKGDTFTYDVRAEFTREQQRTGQSVAPPSAMPCAAARAVRKAGP